MDHVYPVVISAEPLNRFPEPVEDLREFMERPARERPEALAKMKERQVEMLDF